MSGQSPAGKSIGAAEQRRAQEAVFVARWPEQTRAVRPFSRGPPHLTRAIPNENERTAVRSNGRIIAVLLALLSNVASPPLAARGRLTACLALRGRRPEVLDCMKSDRAADRVRAQTPGGNVMYAPPCVFHQGFCIVNMQGGVQMALPPGARCARCSCGRRTSRTARRGGAGRGAIHAPPLCISSVILCRKYTGTRGTDLATGG
jgi:hypothetical protein